MSVKMASKEVYTLRPRAHSAPNSAVAGSLDAVPDSAVAVSPDAAPDSAVAGSPGAAPDSAAAGSHRSCGALATPQLQR